MDSTLLELMLSEDKDMIEIFSTEHSALLAANGRRNDRFLVAAFRRRRFDCVRIHLTWFPELARLIIYYAFDHIEKTYIDMLQFAVEMELYRIKHMIPYSTAVLPILPLHSSYVNLDSVNITPTRLRMVIDRDDTPLRALDHLEERMHHINAMLTIRPDLEITRIIHSMIEAIGNARIEKGDEHSKIV